MVELIQVCIEETHKCQIIFQQHPSVCSSHTQGLHAEALTLPFLNNSPVE